METQLLTVWLTGLPGAGKTTIAERLRTVLPDSYVLDGDELRRTVSADLGFSREDRAENIRRIGEAAVKIAQEGHPVIVAVVSPYEIDRRGVRAAHQAGGVQFVEVYISTPLEVCESRDPKGLYRRARLGEIEHMTGVSDPYEPPVAPEVVVPAHLITVDASVQMITGAISALDRG